MKKVQKSNLFCINAQVLPISFVYTFNSKKFSVPFYDEMLTQEKFLSIKEHLYQVIATSFT